MFAKLNRSASEPTVRPGMAGRKASVWLFAHPSMEEVSNESFTNDLRVVGILFLFTK